MNQVSVDAPVNPARRQLFRRVATAGDPSAPHRAAWKQVIGINADDGLVLWSGWAQGSDVVIVGDEGIILHFNADTPAGGTWQQMAVPTRLPLHAVWGRHPHELYAVGWMGTILSFDGTQWQHQRGGVVDPETKSYANSVENTPLFDITGSPDGRAWAVGDDGVILTLEAGQWRRQDSAARANLRSITHSPSGQLFAAGAEGCVITSDGDGKWERLPCPVAAGFTSVLALSDNELLLGGGRYFVDQGRFCGELVRWKDGEFSVLEFARDMPRIRSLRAYKEGVLIAADRGHLYYLQGQRLDQLRSDSRHDLMDIIPLHTGEALVVGDFSTIMTAADDFVSALVSKDNDTRPEESAWQQQESGTLHNLWGFCEAADSTLFACGDSGTVLQYRADQWQPLPNLGALTVHCLWDSGDGGLYAGTAMGQIYRYDGDSWQLAFDLYLDIAILDIWGSGPDNVFAVGDEGLILHWNGEKWQRMISGTKSALYSLWGHDADRVLAVGDFGLILRWNGENWAEFYAGTDNFLFDVWGDALDNIYIVGLSGTLSRFDGQRWTLMPARARDDIMAIHGRAGQYPYAVGSQGSILHFDGHQWQQESAPLQASLRAVRVRENGDVFVAGNNGVILKRR